MTLELKKNSGLNVKFDRAKPGLIFDKEMNAPEPAVRTLSEMREVILDKDIQSPKELYYMYRNVHLLAEAGLLERNKLRYDLTLIRPDALGSEFMKTSGHYHPGNFGELYEVVFGHAYCLLQRHEISDYRIIKEVIVVKAQSGEKIVIPPGFGHILINPGPDYLVTSNWVSSEFSSEYDLYKEASGAAYFAVTSGTGVEYIPNKYFAELPPIKFLRPAAVIAEFGLKNGDPIYPIIKKDASRLNFLNRPLDFDYTGVFVQ